MYLDDICTIEPIRKRKMLSLGSISTEVVSHDLLPPQEMELYMT